MKELTIFVACHKPCDIYIDDVYQPIHVGRSISSYINQMDMMGDDTGDNISEKNRSYSELTAQYWAWKNYNDSKFVGFCHYRRYYANYLKCIDFIDLFKHGTDVIVAGPCFRYHNRWNWLKTYVGSEDLAILQMVIKKLHPDYYRTFSLYGNDYIDYPLNMFICRKELFSQYAEWLFGILFECEKHILKAPYSRAQRVMGYLSEFLMPIYFIHNNYKITAVQYSRTQYNVNIGGLTNKQKILRWIARHILYRRFLAKDIEIDYSVFAGLESDGIKI